MGHVPTLVVKDGCSRLPRVRLRDPNHVETAEHGVPTPAHKLLREKHTRDRTTREAAEQISGVHCTLPLVARP